MGGKFHLKLNIYGSPIAHKYRKGKVKRTLKRELKVLETAKNQGIRTIGSSVHWLSCLLIYTCRNVSLLSVRLGVFEVGVAAVCVRGHCQNGFILW